MSTLRLGQSLRHPPLAGTWSVWSQSGEAPGAYFVTPADDDARATGIKYAVIRATAKADKPHPELQLIRTDPHKPDLIPATERKTKKR